MFEVKIEVTKSDATLRPGMTTSNAIEVASLDNVLSIPLEAVTSDSGYSYVYKKDGRGVVRQMIEAGSTNDNEIVVRRGLSKDDHVLLTPPADKATIKTEIIPGLQPMLPTTSGDTAKGITLPAKPVERSKSAGNEKSAPVPAGAPAPAPAVKKG